MASVSMRQHQIDLARSPSGSSGQRLPCQLAQSAGCRCVDLLISAGRIPEAAFFSRTYLPSRITEVHHASKAPHRSQPKHVPTLAPPSQAGTEPSAPESIVQHLCVVETS